MIGRTLNESSRDLGALWFWFVPYSNLVSQTIHSLQDNCPDLHPAELSAGLRFDHRAGDVLVSTAQAVSSAGQKRDVLRPKDETLPSIFDAVARARSAGLKIGFVVDEAHIGLSSETEFGRFCRDLAPDRIILATATPRDVKLNQFLAQAEYPDFEAFTVSRDQVVEAHLNKKYVAAIIYRPTAEWQGLADLKKTVLKRAWEQHCALREALDEAHIPLMPLMLVQVANGEGTVAEAKEYLVRDCRVPMDAIGSYEGADNNPGELQRIAQDPTFQVLVFKEAAGTGFDAPRAFILTSTKTVADIDFAAQFTGRIMRVPAAIRARLRVDEDNVPADLQTGYIFLASADAQLGFEGALKQLNEMREDLAGAVEALRERKLPNGTTILTNRPTSQPSFVLPLPIISSPIRVKSIPASERPTTSPKQRGLFADVVSAVAPGAAVAEPAPIKARYNGQRAMRDAFRDLGIEIYGLRQNLDSMPLAFESERRPAVSDMRSIVKAVVRRLPLLSGEIEAIASAAYGNVRAREITTNLVTSAVSEQNVVIEIDRSRLAKEVLSMIAGFPQSSDADARQLVTEMAMRIDGAVRKWLDTVVPSEFRTAERDKRALRDATYLLIRARRHDLTELFSSEIAAKVEVFTADPLPVAMLFPTTIPLGSSTKNIYGVMPPTQRMIDDLHAKTTIDERRLLKPRSIDIGMPRPVTIDGYDGGWALNQSELEFVNCLDSADFVLWWTRNPDRKPYSSGVVRSDSAHRFYPDFIVCLSYWPGADPTLRMIETKFDPVDAATKSKRIPLTYGQVVFLRADRRTDRMFLLNRDGTPGAEVKENLDALKEMLRETS